MISIRMLKNYDRFTKGEVLSHHDVVAQKWIERGLAEKIDQDAPAVSNVATKPAATAAEVEKLKAEAIGEMKRLEAEHHAEVAKLVADAKAAFDMADKATAENAELKKRIAELEKSLAEKGNGKK